MWLSLVAVWTLAQVPCETAGGQARCARTPFGGCVVTNGAVFCGDPSWDTLRALPAPPPVECVTSNGTAACGYACEATDGKVACAQSPLGRCVTTSGRVFCGDPPGWVLRVPGAPAMECVTTSGTGACGYGCVTTDGKAACAQTPWGKCVTTSGRIFCADPPPWVGRVGPPPQLECVTTSGTGTCGYGCVTTDGKAACAQTPWGRCVTTSGRIFCADPPPFAARAGAPLPQMECVTTSGRGACGYDCQTSSGTAACAQVPWGRCVVASGRVTCSP